MQGFTVGTDIIMTYFVMCSIASHAGFYYCRYSHYNDLLGDLFHCIPFGLKIMDNGLIIMDNGLIIMDNGLILMN